MSDIVERLREVAERPDASYPAIMEQAAARIEQLERVLDLFACDCEGKELCTVPDNCRNYAARAALEDKCTSS